VSLLTQVIAYIVSPLATLLVVWVAYLALLKNSQPQLLVYYAPNPDIQTLIDLVIENIGGATATDVTFSKPIPVTWFGIEKPDRAGSFIATSGFPAISAGQRYVYDGGQYAGLASKIGEALPVEVSYKYRNPFGFTCKHHEGFVLSMAHMKHMPTRTSAQQAIVDALTSSNKTTIHEIRDELRALNKSLQVLAQQRAREVGRNGT
jgi:hypothetical protein